MSRHVVLNAEDHRDLRISTVRDIDRGDAAMSCVVVPEEFRRVQNEYPILFRLNLERDRFTALALFGFETGENLFLDDGRWAATYRPLAMEMQPFLIGRDQAGGTKQVHLDLDSPRIAHDGEGIRVFDEIGRPTPFLERIAEHLGEIDEGLGRVDDFFAALKRYELIEPLTLEITLDDGATHRLVGFHAIDEDRLRALDAGALGDLHAEGHLLPIFMALASLSNVADLITRKNRRMTHG